MACSNCGKEISEHTPFCIWSRKWETETRSGAVCPKNAGLYTEAKT